MKTVDIEYIIASASNVKAYGDYEADAQLVFTPRSSEALLQTGIEANDLRVRDLDSFWEPNLDPKIQRLRHEDYSSTRRDLVEDVRKAREKIIKKHARNAPDENDDTTTRIGGGEQDISSLVAQDQARLMKIQMKKKKEIEQMLAFEMQQAQLLEQHEAKIKAEEEKKKKMEAIIAKKKREALEKQKMKDLRRQLEQEHEEKQRRIIAEREFAKAKELANKEKEEEKRRKREAMAKQVELENKQLALRQRTEKIMRQQYNALQKRVQLAEEKERARQELLAIQQAKHAEEVERKQRLAAERIAANKKAMEEAEMAREQEIFQKQQEAEERARMRKEAQEAEFARKQQEAKEAEEKRLLAAERAMQAEEERALAMIERQEQVDMALQEQEYVKQKNAEIRKEEARLRMEAKKRNVERQRRREDYQREQLLSKLDADKAKIDSMLLEKQRLAEKRKEAAIQAKIKREKLAESMEKIRQEKKWHDASKIIEEITGDPKLPKSPKQKPKKKKGIENNTVYQQNLTAHEKRKAAEAVAIRMQRKQDELNQANKDALKAYVSPYEAEMNANVRKVHLDDDNDNMIPAFATEDDGDDYY